MTHTAPVPAPFHRVLAGLEELRQAPRDLFHQCFGCGPEHEIGLRVRCFRAEGEVLAPIVIPTRFAGPPWGAHGGIVAGYLDEVLAGAAVHHTGRIHVTGELTVRFVTPTPVERPILGRGRAVTDGGRYLDLEGRLEDLETGAVFATARGRFFPLPGASEPLSEGS